MKRKLVRDIIHDLRLMSSFKDKQSLVFTLEGVELVMESVSKCEIEGKYLKITGQSKMSSSMTYGYFSIKKMSSMSLHNSSRGYISNVATAREYTKGMLLIYDMEACIGEEIS